MGDGDEFRMFVQRHETSVTAFAADGGDLRYLDSDPGRQTLDLIVDAGRDSD